MKKYSHHSEMMYISKHVSHKLEVDFLVMLDNPECGIGQASSYITGDNPDPLPETRALMNKRLMQLDTKLMNFDLQDQASKQ